MLVRCMRVWQGYVRGKRERRERKRRLVENLAIAINYHEQTLVTKGFLSIIKFRLQSDTHRANFAQINCKVARNMLRFYLHAMLLKFKER